jgi:hypothetical protein
MIEVACSYEAAPRAVFAEKEAKFWATNDRETIQMSSEQWYT